MTIVIDLRIKQTISQLNEILLMLHVYAAKGKLLEFDQGSLPKGEFLLRRTGQKAYFDLQFGNTSLVSVAHKSAALTSHMSGKYPCNIYTLK